jgi:A/G-specific adenine glycosylase
MHGFTQEIYQWFLVNKRNLPWRETNDPFKIWISEIILQQTRVIQGIDYYNRFINEFQNISELANSSEDKVLKLWQGLGYYTRARNLHFTAKYIVNNYNGVFPNDFNAILKLKGVGNYTAAAIASIAFNLPHAVVDGNIYRVLSRYFGVFTPIDSEKGKKEIQKIADDIIDLQNPGFHNQAFMEFGALQCIPKSPDCKSCPLVINCYAAQHNMQDKFPVKSKKIKQTTRFFHYYIIENKNFIFLEKRTGKDIWKNLHQFPLFESKNELTDDEILKLKPSFFNFDEINVRFVSPRIKHILTHQTIYARFIHIETNCNNINDSNIFQVNKKDIYKFAVPKLLEQYLEKLNFTSN